MRVLLEMPALAGLRTLREGRGTSMFAGVDSHKDTLAVAVIKATGWVVDQLQVANQESGFAQLLDLVTDHGVVRVGVEGSGNYGWPAALWLPKRDVAVVEVPPLLTARERSSRPGQGFADQSSRHGQAPRHLRLPRQSEERAGLTSTPSQLDPQCCRWRAANGSTAAQSVGWAEDSECGQLLDQLRLRGQATLHGHEGGTVGSKPGLK